MLMNLPKELRFELVERALARNVGPPRYRITQPGDEQKQRALRKSLPLLHTNLIRQERLND